MKLLHFEDEIVWKGEVLEVDERNGCLFIAGQLRLFGTWEEKAFTRKKIGELRSGGSLARARHMY